MTSRPRRLRDYRSPDERKEEEEGEIAGEDRADGGEGEERPVGSWGIKLDGSANDRDDRADQALNDPVSISIPDDHSGSDIPPRATRLSHPDDGNSDGPSPPPSTATLASLSVTTNTANIIDEHHRLPFSPPLPLSHLYVVTAAHLVRAGADAAIEAPAVRAEVIAVCVNAERAGEIARQTWRARGWGFEEEEEGGAEIWDGIGVENVFLDGRRAFGDGGVGVEVMRVVSRGGRRGEGRVEFEEVDGERRVGVWRVGVDWEGPRGEVEGGGGTPRSE